MTDTAKSALETELRELRIAQHENGPVGGDLPDPDNPDRRIRDRIAELEGALMHSVVLRRAELGTSQAAVGMAVRGDDGRRFIDYALTVGAERPAASGTAAVCAATSPVGRALMGSRVGDIVAIAHSDGRTTHLRILTISEVL